MGKVADTIVPSGRLSLMYADILLKGMKEADFARMPEGVKLNSPAFNFGHLAIYPDRIFEMAGRKDLAKTDQRYLDLFAAGKECVDDPKGTVYPPMNEIVDRFRGRYQALLSWIGEQSDEALCVANPSANERMRALFPTLGAQLAFMIGGHCQTHLGQVSAWRRVMGYGPAEM